VSLTTRGKRNSSHVRMAEVKTKPRKLRVVTTNLFDDNVEELKEIATREGFDNAGRRSSWQVKLRQLVDEALRARRRKRVVS